MPESPGWRGLSEASVPEGGRKLKKALKTLLRKEDFGSITTAKIAKTAGANEALIYRYFGDKRGLLHAVLKESLLRYLADLEKSLENVEGAIDRLKLVAKLNIQYYAKDRVIARIFLLEVRNYPGYFESETYELVKDYGRYMSGLVKEGMDAGEIRNDVSSGHIRDVLLGGLEHFCMPGPIFNRKISPGSDAEELTKIVLDGILKR
jgi:TetR/AcrR family fatty acid metabolism transcriptional regulator